MKKCLVCKKPIRSKQDLCHSCKNFFKWKYGENLDEHLKDFKRGLDTIKFRRLKNEK